MYSVLTIHNFAIAASSLSCRLPCPISCLSLVGVLLPYILALFRYIIKKPSRYTGNSYTCNYWPITSGDYNYHNELHQNLRLYFKVYLTTKSNIRRISWQTDRGITEKPRERKRLNNLKISSENTSTLYLTDFK
jgi:hypothetical protein